MIWTIAWGVALGCLLVVSIYCAASIVGLLWHNLVVIPREFRVVKKLDFYKFMGM